MPFQPGRYTAFAADAAASAKAIHDRQTADLSARRSAPGPLEGLGRLPGAKWVFRTILVGAFAALAVDYLNTPLKPWLQYQLKIPGVNQGKSVAQVAAEESAKAQAEIEENVIKPEGDKVRRQAQQDAAERELSRETHLGGTDVELSRPNTTFYTLGRQDVISRVFEGLPLSEHLSDIYEHMEGVPTNLGRGAEFRPYYFYRNDREKAQHRLALFSSDDEKTEYILAVAGSDLGYFRLDDVRGDIARGPTAPKQAIPKTFATFLRDPALNEGNLTFRDINGDIVTDKDWRSCTTVSQGPSDIEFLCVYTGSVMNNGQIYHLIISPPPNS